MKDWIDDFMNGICIIETYPDKVCWCDICLEERNKVSFFSTIVWRVKMALSSFRRGNNWDNIFGRYWYFVWYSKKLSNAKGVWLNKFFIPKI